MRHARTIYPVRVKKPLAEGEGEELRVFKRGDSKIYRVHELDVVDRVLVENSVDYSHIFGFRDASELPCEEAINALGAALKARPYRWGDSDIPVGYTYLGQFIFHDITWMQSAKKSARTPALDLDSVLTGTKPSDTPERCASDGLFKIGTTFGAPLPEDLPRAELDQPDPGKPLIEDGRNDDFLPLAQCHLLLLKFYNAAARSLGYDGGHRDEAWWQELKSAWVQHFQSIVLNDYLPRIIDSATYWDVRNNGRRIVRAGHAANELAWLPIEFAAAVGRFGHSMIRVSYKPWNSRQEDTYTTVKNFMASSYANSGNQLSKDNDHRLHNTWASNWFMMFDFPGSGFAGPECIKAAYIDTYLAESLSGLPECLFADMCSNETPTPKFDLATHSLKRGLELGLASAQRAIHCANKALGNQIPELTTEQLFPESEGLRHLAEEEHPSLATATPLWFYILREAELLGSGTKLGPLGGRIIMETVHAAIAASENSIINSSRRIVFTPRGKELLTMPDLIMFSADPDPLG